MKKNSGLVPSPWLQLFLAMLALLPWCVLITNAISSKNSPQRQPLSYQANHPLAYGLHYQAP
ncbi:MAG: hypothetical protein KF760_07900 [Candidatus Eremiobacteraeota bacterium]|nr:hypothetical protein [Candidatus Eremiobacteraeota bacterium]MCW5869580.1 hypothetical protein [Candidatus Eremiobacteraeota bacterium]